MNRFARTAAGLALAAVLSAGCAGRFTAGRCGGPEGGCEQDGHVLFRLREYDAALAVWQACLACDPGSARLQNLAGTAYCMQGEYDRAIRMFSRALAGSGGRAGIANNMGYAYACKGDYRRAEVCFRMALMNDEFHTLAAGNLSTVRRVRSGRIREGAYRFFNTGQASAL